MTQPRTLLVMAGGTGGHVFPGLAVAHALREQGWNIVWLGNRTGMEATLVPKHDIPMEYIQFGGLRGKGLVTKFLLPLNLLRAFWQSIGALRRVKPNVVLGMGGYITFPAGMMASLLGRPLVLHEQNSIAGLANKVLAKVADRVLCAFPDTLPGGEWTGNPVREELAHLDAPEARYDQRTGPLRILVVGGSLGAAALNEVVPKAIALLPQSNRPVVTHQAGARQIDTLRANYAAAQVPAQTLPFIDDMARAYADADLVICRAGAMTVSEVAAAGVAALFVPFPHAVDDHQTTNAKFLSSQGAALLVQQQDLTAEGLAQTIASLTRPQLKDMARLARGLAKPEATRRVAEVCSQLARD
ncbi:undecaprenyldiphospho-muramoylpentapeptide beta-N-acetylglucosaminyltransferase [Cupriavidus consociatus]|uniref:undecaprenyldiphospho-muramoylpentapeptide beta-N-acetylglucosaminyltransferase n=1 Tax=Cupriavidus consociatus TaxID=2821357 RepID=UPI001AE51927|nr:MULTISPECIES: undecaprenyldiphospho-muramoylpentapeptide beta-N-acetylglucosaminyltransferase [unclassified Cupriavidus]MBP0622832.1 undecaprenyldiphospho-muramoylpentapeptide beta-N-acetylglucosaminyltransferase [Cupriavidus sp. LEh25]MDK2659519.1 undecaprenyldiphospho-muramoylpentapeptide beta-N-acetylglucosaminyltransferase [Cupriavidus sp. LEh21]